MRCKLNNNYYIYALQGYFFKYINLSRLPQVVSAQSCPPLLLEDPKNSI